MQNRIIADYTSSGILELIGPPYREDKTMRAFADDLSIKHGLKLALPFLITFLVGVIWRGSEPYICLPSWIARDAVAACGDALMVGGVVGVGLELFAHSFLIHQVADELAEKLVGAGLPRELQSLIGTIVKTALVRENFVKTYKVIPPIENGKLEFDVTVSFSAKNFSDTSIDFSPTFQEEQFYDPRSISMEYGVIGESRHTALSRKNANDPTKVLTIDGEKKVKLEPFRRNARAICDVVVRYKIRMPDSYTDITSFAQATTGATLRVEDVPQGYKFVSAGETSKTEQVDGGSWYFDRPFITNQHIRLWWFKS